MSATLLIVPLFSGNYKVLPDIIGLVAKNKPVKKTRKKTSRKTKKEPAPKSSLDILVWTAPEFLEEDRGPLWYLLAALIFIGLEAAALFLLRDNVSSLAIIAAAAILLYHINTKPKEMTYMIDERGFYVNDTFYAPSVIKYFWFSYEPLTTLHVEIKGRALPITALLQDSDLGEIRKAISKFAVEDVDKEEDAIARWVRVLKL